MTIISGFNSYIESDVTIGQDTEVHPFSNIGRGASVGSECVVGPFAEIPRDTIVPEGTTIHRNALENSSA